MLSGQDLGIKLQGFLGWLGNYGHLPYKKQQELLWELGRIKVGLGTLVASNQRISAASQPSITELEEWINQNHPTLNIDETPWSVKGLKEWLWVFANPNFCLFRASDRPLYSNGEILVGKVKNQDFVSLSKDIFFRIVFARNDTVRKH
jgi:transposase